MSPLTEVQEILLKQKMKYNETHGEYTCVICKKKFIGTAAVHRHILAEQHYEYKMPNIKGRLMFA